MSPQRCGLMVAATRIACCIEMEITVHVAAPVEAIDEQSVVTYPWGQGRDCHDVGALRAPAPITELGWWPSRSCEEAQ